MTTTTTTTRYAAIDLHSGYIWGVANAECPENALQIICAEDWTEPEQNFQSCTAGEAWSHNGFEVYKVDDNYDVDDGQNQEEIDNLTDRFGRHPTYWKTTNQSKLENTIR